MALLEQLQFEVTYEQNIDTLEVGMKSVNWLIYPALCPKLSLYMSRSQNLKTALRKFKNSFKKSKPGCIIVYVSSHGEGQCITLCKGTQASVWDELVLPFTELSCPRLSGVPKVFVFDCNIEQIQLPQWHSEAHCGIPPIRNALFAYASSLGMPPFRNSSGSIFTDTFIKVVMENAKDKGLTSLLEEVIKCAYK